MNFDRSQQLHKNIEVKASNRAVKIAYLIPFENSVDNHLIIDAVFYESYTRWSGMRTLMIPTDSENFHCKEYENWLEFYDPDFIYSYVDLESQLIEKIDTLCSPIAFIKHENRSNSGNLHWRNYLPDLRSYINPVSSISTIHSPYAGYRRAFGVGQESIMTLITQYGDEEDRFLHDNFGRAFNLASYTNPIPGLFDTLCLAPADLDERMNVGTRKVNSITDILAQVAEKKAFPISRLAMAHSKAIPYVESYPWSSALNLFIGETCLDRIHFWNARHFSPDYAETQGALIIKLAHFDHQEFIKQLGKFLNNFNFLGQQYGNARVQIRSYSHSYEELAPVREKLHECTFNSVLLEKGIFNAPAIPNKDNLKSSFVSQPDIKTYKVSESINRVPVAEPEHFFYTPPRFIGLNEGQWIIELDIERHNNLSRFSNVIDSWLLPRQNSVVKAFSKNLGRITNAHYLALLPTTETFFLGREKIKRDYAFELNLPDDETVFRLLLLDAQPYRDDLRSGLSKNIYEDMAISDKGQNLRGVISMFTSLDEASKILTNKYWREVLREGKNLSKTDAVFTIAELRGRLPNNRPAKEKLNKELRLKNIGRINSYLEANLLDSLEYLIKKDIFFRIYQWRCLYCGHSNILTFDNMKNTNNCEICSKEHFAGIDLEWKYKLNGFVYGALIERSGLPVLWTLGHLHRFTRNSFYYLPEVDLFPEYRKREQKHEIDLLCVQDGKLYAVEVKLSAIQFIEQEGAVEKFIKKINLINPDIALLSFEQYCESCEDLEATRIRLRDTIKDISEKVKKHIKVIRFVASDFTEFNEHPTDMGFYGRRIFNLFEKMREDKTE